MPWGFYTRPDGDVVALLANPEDRAAYEGKGMVYLGPAPPPGTATDEEIAAAREKVMPKAAAPMAAAEEPAAEEAARPASRPRGTA